jgi:hypothetical protein
VIFDSDEEQPASKKPQKRKRKELKEAKDGNATTIVRKRERV